MNSSLSVRSESDKFGQTFEIFISDNDMQKAKSLFSEQEKTSYERLISGTMAQQMLALTMICYAIEQNKTLGDT